MTPELIFGIVATAAIVVGWWMSYVASVRRDERSLARHEAHATTVTNALGEVKTEIKEVRAEVKDVSTRVARMEGALRVPVEGK